MSGKNNKEQRLLIPYYKNIGDRGSSFFLTKDGVINKSIVNNLDSDVVILDKALNIVFMNSTAEKTWGVRFEDVVGTSYLSMRLRSIEKGLSHNLNDVVKAKKTISMKELQLVFPDNITHFLDLNCTPIYDENGQVQGVLSVSKDVTKRVHKDIAYQEARKIVKSLTHELEAKETEVQRLQKVLKGRHSFYNLIGKNHLMQDIYELIEKVAKTDSTIFITGETGTGKELAAKALHYNSTRANHNFIAVNCAALPESLIESELFGHVKGSFTGAIRDKKGKFELADRGTLFLDEVGELSIPTQVKLLRALQEREIERVGDEKKIKVDIRIIAATNKGLLELIEEGKFRKDLYYRLNVISLTLPPLRERTDDVPLLVEHFIEKFNKQFKREIAGVSTHALKKLMSHSWPGNVRELEGVIEKAVILAQSDVIQDIDSLSEGFVPDPVSYNDMLSFIDEYEKKYFISVFERFNGKINDIAMHTGISRRSILNKMKKFKIKKSEFKN